MATKKINKYLEMEKRHSQIYDDMIASKIHFAFGRQQFEEAMHEIGLDPDNDTDKIVPTAAGGFMLKDDYHLYIEIGRLFADDMYAEIEADPKGTGFIKDMFDYELANHEYGYTGDTSETIESLGLDDEDFAKYPQLRKGLNLALKRYQEIV